MKDKRIKKIILWTIVIAYTLWIFHNSAQTGKVSANLSQTLSYRIYDSLQFLHFMPFKLFHTLIRKFAHFSEYALLGILVSTVSSHTIEERQQKLVIILRKLQHEADDGNHGDNQSIEVPSTVQGFSEEAFKVIKIEVDISI